MTGGLASAFLASLCCVGPLVLSAVAAVGATAIVGAAATLFRSLVPLRPLFITMTLILIGASFYGVYRAQPAWADGASCNPLMVRRAKRILWAVVVLSMLLLASPYLLAIGS